jgi:hypothetical protein
MSLHTHTEHPAVTEHRLGREEAQKRVAAFNASEAARIGAEVEHDRNVAAAERARIAAVPIPKFSVKLPSENPLIAEARAKVADLYAKSEAAAKLAEERRAAFVRQNDAVGARDRAQALAEGREPAYLSPPELAVTDLRAKDAEAAAKLAEGRVDSLVRQVSAEVAAESKPIVRAMLIEAWEAAQRFAECERRVADFYAALKAKGFAGPRYDQPSGFDLKGYRETIAKSGTRPFGESTQ